MRTTFVMLLHVLAATAETPDAAIRSAMKEYLDGVTGNDTNLKKNAVAELFSDQVRRSLNQAAPSAGTTVETMAFRRTEFVAASRAIDRQRAGDAGNAGTTTLASLSGVSDLISAATESGLVNRTTEGPVSTFRLNASALARMFKPEEPCFLRLAECKPTLEQRLKGFSLAAAFAQESPEVTDPETTGTVDETKTALPEGAQLPGLSRVGKLRTLSFRGELRRKKSITDATQQEAWKTAMKDVRPQAQALAISLNRFVAGLSADPGWRSWMNDSTKELDQIASSQETESDKLEKMVHVYKDGLANFVDNAQEPLVRSAVAAMESLLEFRRMRNTLLHDALYPSSATLEYLYQRPAHQPEYSTVRLIIGKPFGEQKETKGPEGEPEKAPLSQFTANFAFSLYHARPASIGRFRDAQGAVQLDRFLPLKSGSQKAVFSVAGYYQYMAQKGVLEFDGQELTPFVGIPLPQAANVLLDTKGSMFIAQAKMTFPIGDSGVNFPVAVSWANRSELIKASYTKFQFGFTFDLDKLIKEQKAKQ